LAVLNACEGARTSRKDPFAGVAQSLMRQGLPAVVAMQFEITDSAAITFAHSFYTAIANGYPVDAALSEARKAIFTQGNELEWGTPVLYLRSPDGRIIQPTPEDKEKRGLGKRIVLWLGAISALVTILSFLLGLQDMWSFKPKSARLYGDVKYEGSDTGVAGANIEVRSQIGSPVIGSGVTGSKGAFDFPVKEKWDEVVYVTVVLDDSVGFEHQVALRRGNRVFPFKAFKRKP